MHPAALDAFAAAAWNGHRLNSARYWSDGTMMILKEAVARPFWGECLAAQEISPRRHVDGVEARATWENYETSLPQHVDVYQYASTGDGYALLSLTPKVSVTVNPAKLAFAAAVTLADGILISGPEKPVLLTKAGVLVAVVASMREEMTL